MNQPTQPQACGYSIDADPQGIRALTADAIHGALAFGFQGVSPPPEGHWLTMFWKIGRDARAAQPAAEPIFYLNPRIIGENGKVNVSGRYPITWAPEPYGAWTMPVYLAAQPARASMDTPDQLSAAIMNLQPQKVVPGLAAGTAYDLGFHDARAAAAALAAAPKPAAPTLMTEDQASKWAWDQVRQEVSTEGWTAGDSCNFFGFFMHGWRYRGQYELQRRAALSMAAPVEQAAAPTITLTLEQARTLAEALDIGIECAAEDAAQFHEGMAGYVPGEHERWDRDVAKVKAAGALLGQLIQGAEGAQGVQHG